MICPYCHTDNRDDRELCYHCNRDLTMLRVIVNKAKHHYNQALEYAERDRTDDAIHELQNTLDLDGSMIDAHVVLGTLYAKQNEFGKARDEWNAALALDHRLQEAHDYLNKAEHAVVVFPIVRRLKTINLGMLVLVGLIVALWGGRPSSTYARRAVRAMHQTLERNGQGDLNIDASLRHSVRKATIPSQPPIVRVAAASLARAIESAATRPADRCPRRPGRGRTARVLAPGVPVGRRRRQDPGGRYRQIRTQAERKWLARVDDARVSSAPGAGDQDSCARPPRRRPPPPDGTAPARRQIEPSCPRQSPAPNTS